jgi:hypothetical protein
LGVEPVLPPGPAEGAGADGASGSSGAAEAPGPAGESETRPVVTLRPLFTYLMIFDLIIGFLWGMFLFVITNLAGAPTFVQALAMLSGIVVWLYSWWRTTIKFTPAELIVTRLIAPHHVPWYRVTNVSLYDMWDSDTDQVTGRRIDVRYRREAEPPVEPMPTVFGEWRIWNRKYFRSLALPVFFRPPEDPFNYVPREPRTWLGRYTNRQRQIIRAEFAARGYDLPELGPLSRWPGRR